MMRVGDRATFTLYGEVIGPVTIVQAVGDASDAYQWSIKADDGRDFVATDEELELL